MDLGLETLLFNAVEMTDVEARDAYLRQVCGSDGAKLAELQSMVRDYFAAGSYLDRAATVPPTLAADGNHHLGLQIGPYRLRELLGEGGMGCVYVAEQQRPVRRKVALKIIKPGMDSRHVISRFESERQALALMDHPNIAKVLDAGTTDNGLPYFVMELVKGAPITEYCDDQKLGTRQRLELFIQVCQAVQHAHQKGIIHRDIKPSNVMVTVHDVTPVVKVIDFGVAKAIGQQLTDNTLYTAVSQMIGTPLYMSPEQAGESGLDIDTRSDVYSLGVVLYELLTGNTPFDKDSLKQAGYDEVRRIIREVDPPKPSHRVSTLKAEEQSTVAEKRQVEPRKLSHQFRGELDWIVMKAIEKDRERRYDSAISFASDVQRFLDDLPVKASPPSSLYLLRKLARRHRLGLITSAALVCTMMTATALSTRYAFITDRALTESERDRKAADAQRAIAEMRQKESDRLKLEAIAQRNTTQQALYKADIRLAGIDHHDVNPLRLHKALEAHIPVENAPDQRAWEWHYLLGASHQEVSAILGHRAMIEDVDWSPDGKRIASTGWDGARIWDASTETQIYENEDGFSGKIGGAWSPDSRSYAWGSLDSENIIRTWDSSSNELTLLKGHRSSVHQVCWSPDGRRLLSASLDKTCRVWDVATQECLCVVKFDGGGRFDACWNPVREYAAIAGGGKNVLIIDPTTGDVIAKITASAAVLSAAFSTDGSKLIIGDSSGRCIIHDVGNWKVLLDFEAHNNGIHGIAANPKYPSFATCGADGVAHIWRLADGGKHSTLFGHDGAVNDIDWDSTGLRLVTGSSDQRVLTWNVLDSPTFHRISLGNASASAITWDADSSHLSCTTQEGSIASIDIATREVVKSSAQDGQVVSDHQPKSAAMEEYLESCARGQTTRNKQYFVDSNREGILWSGDESKVAVVTSIKIPTELGADDEMVVTHSEIEIWDAREKACVLSTRIQGATDAQWAPDHRRLAVAGRGQSRDGGNLAHAGWVYIFNGESGVVEHKLRHGWARESATALSWNPIGTRIVAGNVTGLVCIWDAAEGKLLKSLAVHQARIRSIAWSPDAKRIASTDSRGQVKILDAETLEELLTLSEGAGGMKQLAWSRDGHQLAGIHSSGNVIIWNASRGFAYSNSDTFRSRITAQNTDELLAEVEFHRKKNDLDAAIRVLDQLLQTDTDHVIALMVRGRVFYNLSRFTLAIADFERVTELVPDHQVAWNWLGVSQTRLGLFDEAIVSLTAAYDANPETGNYGPTANRAIAYIQRGDVEKGKSELQPLFDKLPIDAAGSYLAELYISRGETDSYAELCQRVLDYIQREQTTDYYVILEGCSIICRAPSAIHDYQPLLSIVQKIQKQNSDASWANFHFGAALFRAGKLEQALEYLTLASNQGDNGANQVDVDYFLAFTHRALGHNELAQESLAKARSIAQEYYVNGSAPDWYQQKRLDRHESEAMRLFPAQ